MDTTFRIFLCCNCVLPDVHRCPELGFCGIVTLCPIAQAVVQLFSLARRTQTAFRHAVEVQLEFCPLASVFLGRSVEKRLRLEKP